jgi:hypothetical protein
MYADIDKKYGIIKFQCCTLEFTHIYIESSGVYLALLSILDVSGSNLRYDNIFQEFLHFAPGECWDKTST